MCVSKDLKDADMARLSLSQSPKFKVLVRSLKLPIAHVRGYLELLWESTHFRDDPYFTSLAEIEAAADWQGEDDVFAKILIRLRWIDEHNGGYVIHDYEDNLPSYVKERRRKHNYRQSLRGRAQDKSGLSQDSPVTVAGQSNQEEWNGMEWKEKKENNNIQTLVLPEAESTPIPPMKSKPQFKKRRTKPIDIVEPSQFAIEVGAKYNTTIKQKYPTSSIDDITQARAVQVLLEREYTETEIREVLNFIRTHGDDRFAWRDQMRSLAKLDQKPKVGSAGEDYDKWIDYFLELVNQKKKAGIL